MERVTDLADPRRCQGAAKTGQCWNVALPTSRFCKAHGGSLTDPEAAAKRRYLLNDVREQVRLNELVEHGKLTSLREEIALFQLMINERWNMAKTPVEKQQAMAAVDSMARTLEKLQKTYFQLEKESGNLLPREELVVRGQALAQAMLEELEGLEDYELLCDRILDRFLQIISADVGTIRLKETQTLLPPSGEE